MTENPNHSIIKPEDLKVPYRDGQGRLWEIVLECKTINGRSDLASIRVTSADLRAPITRRLLRELPLDLLLGRALVNESKRVEAVIRSRKGVTAHRGRQHSDFELREVADVYVAAYKARIPVQDAVAKAQGVSVSTAAKRIMAARGRGLIPDDINMGSH